MPVRLLIVLLAVATAVPLALAWRADDGAVAVYAVPFALAFAAALAFRPQLDWAYYRRRPADLEAPVRALFAAQLPGYYQALDADAQRRFRERVFLTRLGLDFKPMAMGDAEELPPDLQALLASQLARVLDGLPRFTVTPFETVVVYRHPFDSPEHPGVFHHSELYAEDGVLIFNLEYALPGILRPRERFNVVLYEWLRAAAQADPPVALPTPPDGPWEDLVARLARRTPDWVTGAVGLEVVDETAVKRVLAMEFGLGGQNAAT